MSSAWVGPREELVGRLRVREALQSQIPFMASAAFLAIGLFALAVWARHRDDTAYLLFFVASVLFFVRCLHYHTGQRTPLIPEAWFGWITVNSLGWLLLCVYFFAFRLHERRLPWLERGALAVMALSTVLTLPGWASWGRADVITSAAYGVLKRGAKFAWAISPLPYYPDAAGAPGSGPGADQRGVLAGDARGGAFARWRAGGDHGGGHRQPRSAGGGGII